MQRFTLFLSALLAILMSGLLLFGLLTVGFVTFCLSTVLLAVSYGYQRFFTQPPRGPVIIDVQQEYVSTPQ